MVDLKPGGGWRVGPERVGRPKRPGSGAFPKVLEAAKTTPAPRKIAGSGGIVTKNLSLERDAKAQEANLKQANTIPPEPIWYTPGEKEASIPSGLNPGGGAAAARAMPDAQPAPTAAAPRPYHHTPLHRAEQAAQAAAQAPAYDDARPPPVGTPEHRAWLRAGKRRAGAPPEAMDAEPTPPRQEERMSDARRLELAEVEAERRAKNNKRLQKHIRNYKSRSWTEPPSGNSAEIAYKTRFSDNARGIHRRETVARERARPASRDATNLNGTRRAEMASPAVGETTPNRPSTAAPRTQSLREEHADKRGDRDTPERFRPPADRNEAKNEKASRAHVPEAPPRNADVDDGAHAQEDRYPTPKRFNHRTPNEEHNRLQKESIRAKEDALRLMFPGIPNNLLRRAVYDGFLMDPSRKPGQLVFVRRGPLGGTGVANPEITDYLRPYNVHGLGRVPGPPRGKR